MMRSTNSTGRSSAALRRVIALALALVPVGFALGQTPSPPPTAPSPIEAAAEGSTALVVTPDAVPKRPEDVPPIREKISTRRAGLETLRLGENPTPAQQALAQAADPLREALDACLKQLDAFEKAHQTAADLGSAERIAARNAQLEQYRRRAAELRTARPRRWSPAQVAEEKQDLAAEYEKINTLTDTTVKQQTARAQVLNQFPQQVQDVAKRATESRQALSAYLKRTPVAPSPDPSDDRTTLDSETQRQVRELAARALAWQVFLANLRAEQLAIDKVVLTLEAAAAESTIPVLQEYAKALGDYRSKLDLVAARGELGVIADELAAAGDSPQRTAYWRVREIIATGRQSFASKLDDIRGRFRESARQELVQDMNGIAGVYDRLQERLSRTTGTEKTSAYRRLAGLIEDYALEREEVSARLDFAQRELDALLEQADEIDDLLRTALATLGDAAAGIETPEDRQEFDRLGAELASEHRPSLQATIDEVTKAEQAVIERLEDADDELRQFNEQLQIYRERLFWSYTTARGAHVAQQFRAAQREVGEGGLRSDLRGAGATIRKQVAGIGRNAWRSAAAVVVLMFACGWYLRHRCRQDADRREEKIAADLQEREANEVHLNDRVRIQGGRMLGLILPLGLPVAVLLLLVLFGGVVQGDTRIAAAQLLTVVLLALVVRVLVKQLFRSGKPRFRIIPCSNVVAGYYRFWMSVLWWVVVVLVPVALVMNVLDVAPVVANAIWTLHVLLALLVLLGFARNRQTVVRVVGRAFALRRPTLFSFIVRVYPLVVLLLLALFVLEAVGYGALVDYVVRNLLLTLIALGAAALLSSMLNDFVRKNTADPVQQASSTTGETPPEFSFDDLLEQFETRELGLLLSSLATVGQWAVWLGAVVWTAGAWGMTRITAKRILEYPLNSAAPDSGRAPVTVGLLLAGIFVVYASFKLSRLIRHALSSKVYPAYGHINRAAQATINSLLHYTLITIGLYIGLRLVQIELGALALMLGGLGLGLGLGLQPLVVNFVSGLLLYAERHVKVGDIVAVGDDLGEVMSISMRSTQIKSFDGIDIIIPNSEFVTNKVTNWTLQDTKIRGKLNIGVAYGSDVQQVRDILLNIARHEPRTLPEPEPAVWFTDFAESSLNFIVACWYPTPGDRWFGMIDMRYEIDKQFKEAGIEIPFPQRTLSLHPDARIPVTLIDERRSRVDGGDNHAAETTDRSTPQPAATPSGTSG